MSLSVLARAGGALVVAATLAIGVTGCGSAISGQATPGMTPANLAALNTGPYQSTPQVYRPKISYNTQVFHIESRRMMGYIVSPYQIDPDMKLLEAVRVIDQSSFRSITGEFPESYAPIAERNHLIGGALTTRSNGDLRNRKFMTISIMRFPNDAAARAAATEFDQDSANSLPGRHGIALDGVANAMASSVTDAKGWVYAWRGPFVVLSMVTVPKPDPNAIATQLKKMLQLQDARLAELNPTPVDDILDLPLDTDRIMSLALRAAKGSPGVFLREENIGIYSPTGQLHFERDAAVATKAFADAGVDLVGQNDGTVYRTRDLAAAFRLQTALTVLGKNDEEAADPPGVTDARCIQLDEAEPIRNDKYLCAMVYGRYVAVIGANATFSGNAPDAAFYQRAAAQYSILAKNG
ncbi:hypothetical protein [Nocardia sp. NPDC052112]|uniref:DUF7373 family lipoprotein n=1 Tax=Nocardia sp. NPDC052112 TaxID=3155646 RepID=UPI0034423DA1